MRIPLSWIKYALITFYVFVAIPLWGGYLRQSANTSGGRLTGYLESQRRLTREKDQVRTMNLLMPAGYQELTAFLNASVGPEPQALFPFIAYYRTLTEVLPKPVSADAHAMLGFCYFHQGKTDEALANYTRSLEQNPVFLSTYFNLALLHVRAGNYAQASELISRMMTLTPELTLRIIASSKIYTDILRDGSGMDPSTEIKKTYAVRCACWSSVFTIRGDSRKCLTPRNMPLPQVLALSISSNITRRCPWPVKTMA